MKISDWLSSLFGKKKQRIEVEELFEQDLQPGAEEANSEVDELVEKGLQHGAEAASGEVDELVEKGLQHGAEAASGEVDELVEQDFQYGAEAASGEVDLVIGLDFGTSATKVVVRAPDLPGSPAYPVNFESLGHQSMPQLLPTALWVDEDGNCDLSEISRSTHVLEIKTRLLGFNAQNLDPIYPPDAIATAYLALVLLHTRQWFLEKHQNLIVSYESIFWAYNLGVPSPCTGENDLSRRFRLIGIAAWRLSFKTDSITIMDAQKELARGAASTNSVSESTETEPCDFEIIPEIAAGAVSYARSDLRTSGLHFMIDYGAATVDACAFILNDRRKGNSDEYGLLVADVKRLGVAELNKQRVKAIEKHDSEAARSLNREYNPFDPLPLEVAIEQFPHSILEILESIDKKLVKKCAIMYKAILYATRRFRAPNEDEWSVNSLPVLLIGGGRQNKIYRESIRELSFWFKKQYIRNPYGIKELPLPVTETPDGDPVAYERLAVAYGLSYRSLDIGEITAVDQIPDMPHFGNQDENDNSEDYGLADVG